LYNQLKIYCILLFLWLLAISAKGQFTISGTVYDSSKIVPVRDVVVKSSGGTMTTTDSTGHYNIIASDKDSLTFIYLNKPTARFAVKQIENIGSFDISLHIRVNEKFRTLKEVRVFSNSFKQDSIANREQYAKIFNYQKPGITTTTSDYSGAAGMDLDEFINIFRFKRNKQLKYMQNRLLEQEQEKYINYRFNKTLVKRITRLEGKNLDTFMVLYRPDFDFTHNSNTINFYQYILNASYQFRRELLGGEVKKENQ
jgi:hypothetical protein